MSLPMPKLDDRTFDDLMAEAMRRIPALCPDWTDLNPSDPGVTALELMAWMTEVLLYRVNRIPDKCFIELLGLMGVKLQSGVAARTWLTFAVAAGTTEENLPEIPIPAGTRVATQPRVEQPLVFETCDPLYLTSAQIVDLRARLGEDITVLSCLRKPGGSPKEFFEGGLAVPHHLYLGDAQLEESMPNRLLHIELVLTAPRNVPFGIEWEWCTRSERDPNGIEWKPWLALKDTTSGMRNSGTMTFEMPSVACPSEVNGRKSVWLRARLVGTSADTNQLPEIQRLTRSFEVPGTNGLLLDRIYLQSVSQVFQDLSIGGDFEPFGPAPEPGAILYLGSGAFANDNAQFVLSIVLAGGVAPPNNGRSGVELVWEYRRADGAWRPLGIATEVGARDALHGFEDHTCAFTQNGRVAFERPPDMAEQTILGETDWFIRVRMSSGSYDAPQRSPPKIQGLRLAFSEKPQPWEHVVTINDNTSQDQTLNARDGVPFLPFIFNDNGETAFYLALDRKPSNRAQRIFFDIDSDETDATAQIAWSYRGEKDWQSLTVLNDTTHALSARGAITFLAAEDWREAELFDKDKGYWLRATWKVADLPRAPVLRAVYLNAVEAVQARERFDEALARRDEERRVGEREPFQVFVFPEAPMLAGPQILVKELDNPTEAQVSALIEEVGHDKVEEERDETKRILGIWVKWKEVENFFKSSRDDRHYMIDLFNGTVTFGDGSRGKIPPAGLVKARNYRISEGSRGNVGVDTVTVLQDSYASVENVRNVVPATGGADPETIDHAKQRGPWTLRHRHRAVTTKDFEWLAHEASPDVALARCSCESNSVHVVIVPQSKGDRPFPSWQLVDRVRQYLDSRRLATTRFYVDGPKYDAIDVRVLVVLAATHLGRAAEVRERICESLRAFTHPLSGGPTNTGWPIGRTLHISELYYVLEQVEGVDYADRVHMSRQNSEQWVDKISLGTASYPYLTSITVTQV